MGDPTSSYATAGIALRVSGALKPHHQDKVETLLVGTSIRLHSLMSQKMAAFVVTALKTTKPLESY
jgi:hypothetical protein